MKMARLGEVCAIRSGGTPSRSRSDYYGGPVPWAKIADIECSDGQLYTTEETITEAGLAAIRGRLFPTGTLLFSIYGSIGKMAFCGRPVATNQAILGIEIPADGPINSRYLYRYLEALRSKLQNDGIGVTQKNLSAAYVRDIAVPIPPLPEQRRIAAILDQADALRRLRRQSLSRLSDLGQAIFFEMFGDLNKSSQPLKALGRVVTGSTPPSSAEGMFGGSIPFVTPGDLGSAEASARFVTDAGAKKSRLVAGGSTLVCCIGATIGKMDQAARESAFNQQINAIEWGERVRDDYGFYAVRSLRDVIIFRGKGASTTLPILKKSEFEKLEIKVADLPLQDLFAERLAAVRALKREGIAGLEGSTSLFASLQHRAFRGEL